MSESLGGLPRERGDGAAEVRPVELFFDLVYGPILCLAGHALFKLALWGAVPPSRLVALGALAALVPLAVVSSALVLMVAATLVLVVLALWEMRAERVRRGSTQAPAR